MRRIFYAVFGLFCLCAGTAAFAQAPERAGRLSYAEGAVSVRVQDDERWAPAQINLPVTTGTAIWTQPGARAEVQVGSTAIRVDGESEVDFVRLDDTGVEIAVPAGAVNVHRAPESDGPIWVATPGGPVAIAEPGFYRVAGGAVIRAEAAPSEFDRWAMAREAAEMRAAAATSPYVSPNITGYQDLAAYGDWTVTPSYGAVWIPRAVPIGWAPYRYGHWAYVWPWGWTWIDDAPWGFAPFHYGSWIELHGRWGWWPGERFARPLYVPARVVFLGGGHARHTPPTRWVPLAPREAAPRVDVHVRIDVNRFVNRGAVSALPHTSVVREASRREPQRAEGRPAAVATPAVPTAPRVASQAAPQRAQAPRVVERPERTAIERSDRAVDHRPPIETRIAPPTPAPDIRARLAAPPSAARPATREPARAEAVEPQPRRQLPPNAAAVTPRRESVPPRSATRLDAPVTQPRPNVQTAPQREIPRVVRPQAQPQRPVARIEPSPRRPAPEAQPPASPSPQARHAPQPDRGARDRHDRRDDARTKGGA